MPSTLARPRTGSRALALLSFLAALVLVVSACGSSTDTEAESATEGGATDGAGTEAETDDTRAELSSSTAGDGSDTGDGAGDDGTAGDDAGSDDAAGDTDDASTDGDGAGTMTEFATIGELLEARGVDSALVASRFEGRIEMTGSPGSGMPESFSMTFTGAQDPDNRASDVSVDFGEFMAAMAESEGGSTQQELAMMSTIFDEPMRVITIGDSAYVQWALVTMFAGGAGDEWVETDVTGADDIAAQFGSGTFGSSTEALGPFTDADADVVEVGAETVRGIDTVHYRADVRLKEFYQSLSVEERAAFDQQFEMGDVAVDTVPVELWIDDDGHIVRMRYSVSDPAMFDQADGVESVDITIETYDFGAEIEITPPPADKIVSEEDLGFDPGG